MRCIRKDNEDVVTKFVKSVIAGDMEQALTLMRAYLAGVSYRLSNKTERDVQTTARISHGIVDGPPYHVCVKLVAPRIK